MKFTFDTLSITHEPYAFFILPFRYLSNVHYKNEKFLENVVRYLNRGRYNGMVFLGVSAT
jgi:hypothetical protein